MALDIEDALLESEIEYAIRHHGLAIHYFEHETIITGIGGNVQGDVVFVGEYNPILTVGVLKYCR